MSEDFKGPLIRLDGPHSTFEVYFGPDNMSKLFFSVVVETDPGLTPHIKTVVSAACLTQDAAAFQHKDVFLVRGLGGKTVIDRYLFRFHGENSLRLGLSDSSGVQRIEEEQSDVPQGCHFGYLG